MNIKYTSIFTLIFSLSIILNSSFAQNQISVGVEEVKPMNFIKITPPVRDMDLIDDGELVRFPKVGYHSKGDWKLHEKTNPFALPLGEDPVWQKDHNKMYRSSNVLTSWEGLNTAVGVGDPSLDVGPNHVVQMVNSGGGSEVGIWDKSGTLLSTFIFDTVSGLDGFGDPIVIYDQLADRWLLTEFQPQGFNTLVIAISTSPDPTGSYAIYTIPTPNFPDYPKYSIWHDTYILTTNENVPRVYALERAKMLAGDPTATFQQFNLSLFPTLNFQTATPVNLDGTNLPPSGASAMFMRMADDGWDQAGTVIPADRLEIFDVTVDFNNSANSSVNGPIFLPTAPFDTEIDGYTLFQGIPQPNSSITLDPVIEVLMNKIMYRNFGSHESIVCNHVTDVTGNDDAGVRWYELRRTGGSTGSWSIYQQGTYSPDNASRWMGSISINGDGSIGLGFNISDATSIFPGLRYTGRKECDPLGVMTIAETTIIDGSAPNGTNRYGDYNTLSIDPNDGTFWFTGQYNPSTSWASRIAQFELTFDCFGFDLTTAQPEYTTCAPNDIIIPIEMESFGGFSANVNLSVTGLPAGATANFAPATISGNASSTLTISGLGSVAPGTYTISINGSGGGEMASASVDLNVFTPITTAPTLLTLPNGSVDHPISGNTLTWVADPNASSYIIDIATDAAMTNNIESVQGITGNSHTINATLLNNTRYYWTVTPTNICGDGPSAMVWSFGTTDASCSTQSATNTPIFLFTFGTSSNQSDIIFSGGSNISDVIITMDIEHTNISDLEIELESPSGTVVQIINGLCPGNANLIETFSQFGAPHSSIPCPPIDNNLYMASGSLSDFNGEPATGTWILRIVDNVAVDGGIFNDWTLTICTDSPSNLVPPTDINGCKDAMAHNYDYTATIDDGSCITCSDGIMNGDETAVDCGGTNPNCMSCAPIATCTDGIMNQDETGIDCGGATCPPCMGCTDSMAHNFDPNAGADDGSCLTCSDGIQNADEGGVDCGGINPNCPLCPCTDVNLTYTGPFNIPNNTHKLVDNIILMDGTPGVVQLPGTRDASFRAGNYIELLPEFNVNLGATILLDIQPCN